MVDFAGNFLAGHMGAREQARSDQRQQNANALAPLQQERLQVGIDQTRQSMAIDQERMTMLRQKAAQEAAAAIRTQADAEAAQADIEQGRRLIATAAAGGPGAEMAWRELATGIGNPDLPFSRESLALAGEVFSGLEEGFLSAAGNAAFGAAEPETELTSGMREYQFAVDQGFDGTFADWKAGGRPQTNINVNTGETGPRVGSIPQGYMLRPSEDGASYTMEPIRGGPADTTANDIAREDQSTRASSIVLEDIDRVQKKIENAPFWSPTTGAFGNFISRIGGTRAYDVGALLRTVGGNIGFDRLQQMRDASPTGGALGAINQQELNLLMSVMGSLEQSQSEGQLLENLDRLEKVYTGILEKAAAYPNAAEFGFDRAAPTSGGTDDLTPEERQYLGLD